MSRKLITHSHDLQKLENDSFVVEIKEGRLLLIHDVPYVNGKGEVARGILVSKLELLGDRTASPVDDHVVHFIGEHPCHKDGSIITAIKNASETKLFENAVTINHTFSSKRPDRKYTDYHEKMTQYVKILSAEAQAIDPRVTAQTGRIIETIDPDSVFHYADTNASRAEIVAISDKLKNLKIAIVGLGGTGSYVLDYVAKTEVGAVHLFDGDRFLRHNAFRAPGAASIAELNEGLKKVTYLHRKYSVLHKHIHAHEYPIDAGNVEELTGMDFVFLCIDQTNVKELIIAKLIERGIPFVDVGMGINAIGSALTGSIRVTTATKEKNDHLQKRISMGPRRENDYAQNIQIAELNSLNAALAVVKWKKLFGFYHDLSKEHNCSYSINMNKILNDDTLA